MEGVRRPGRSAGAGQPRRSTPTRAELHAAAGRRVPDIIAPELRILFCGINPSLYSGATGHHFARPGNRFWKAVHGAGITPRLIDPRDDRSLLEYGCGITNFVERATAAESDLSPDEFKQGKDALARKVRRYRPGVLAVLGVGAYRHGFGRPRAGIGEQPEPLEGTPVWVLPNPSGLNANYRIEDLVRLFSQMREAAGKPWPSEAEDGG